ncbi:MAG: energy-coupling factor transporter transmembrane protein EcfT [Firmicutes bacterium]|nr:energy-coupling factor transporter transmembrane protein EcfT [Bacillota bacterium]
MAEMTFFHYFPRDSLIHRMDARLKLLCMILLSVAATLAGTVTEFAFLTFVLGGAICLARLPVVALLKDMRLFALLILLLVAANAFFVPGRPLPYLSIPGVSQEGLVMGLRFAWRLLLILMVCMVMTGATSLLTFKNVVEWYLRPVPLVPAARVATMMNLTFVLFPVIFDTYAEMRAAQKARCIETRKNIIKRVMFTVAPLLSQTLRKADEIAYAMEARCYTEERTRAVFRTKAQDWVLTAVCLVICLAVALR